MLHAEKDSSDAVGATTLESLDKLSVRFMIEGPNESTLADLRRVSEAAATHGSSEIAQRAATLVNALQTTSGESADALLKVGMTELRQMMENEKNGLSASASPAYAMFEDDAELVADFLVEAREHLSLIEGQMLSLERDPNAIEVIHAVFRAFHTIKGLAGFLGFSVMQAVSHEVETLLDLARNQKIIIDPPIVDVVLESADFLLVEMASIDRVLSGADPIDPASNGVLIARIRALTEATILPLPSESPLRPEEASNAAITSSRKKAKPSKAKSSTTKLASKDDSAVSKERPSSPLSVQTPELNLLHGATPDDVTQPVISYAEPEVDDFFSAPYAQEAVQAPTPPVEPPNPSLRVATSTPAPAKGAEPARSTEVTKTPDAGSVRVETAKLDHLMDMVGEMVIAQSLIRHSQVLLSATDSRLIGDLSHLARVTAEVQRATMSMRMVPIAQLFQKIERVIRDLSRKAGKQVVLQTSGTDTEVDKTVAEELSDPLLHMVRNSMDHGIETREERIAAGKSPVAVIKLAAYHQGGQIVIEISDDGRGLNPEKIRRKAEQKEIVSPNLQLTEIEIYQLIFAPGFSTAEAITDVSGRGVGMDVVRRNVEKLRGRIETLSTLGAGTTFLLKLPLTLAIIDGLVIEVGTNHYIVPLSVVREIFRPLEDTVFTVEGREEMVLVREQLLPIVRLNHRLNIGSNVNHPREGLLVVIESESKLYCLLVDDLLGKQEVVIKSLGETFQDASGFSGCAVLGDGRVGLILDTDGIYRGKRR